jgi:hypothetical protein
MHHFFQQSAHNTCSVLLFSFHPFTHARNLFGPKLVPVGPNLVHYPASFCKVDKNKKSPETLIEQHFKGFLCITLQSKKINESRIQRLEIR